MAPRTRLSVLRRGARHSFDLDRPETFCNGAFLFMTIVLAATGAVSVDAGVSYALAATVWILVVYVRGFELLGHVVELEEKLTEPQESLQAMRECAAGFPLAGMLPFLAVMALT